jgi:hypothetical protein
VLSLPPAGSVLRSRVATPQPDARKRHAASDLRLLKITPPAAESLHERGKLCRLFHLCRLCQLFRAPQARFTLAPRTRLGLEI